MSKQIISKIELIKILKNECNKVGTAKEWCRKHKANETRVSEFLNDIRTPKSILKILGYKTITFYTKV